MGNLIKETPYSEITATLEILERFGVGREHLTALRKAASAKQMEVANTFISLLDDSSEGDGRSNLNIFKVAVNYARPLMEMIRAGKYDYVNSDIIAKHFPVKGKDILPVELELVHLNKYISSDDAIAEIKQRGFRPAKIEELLAFGEKYPEEQRKYPIVTLGSVWQHWYGGRSVPYLYRHDGRRGLDLNCFEYVWNEDCRFLVVRESVCR